MTLTDISDLLPLMPRAVDFVWHRGRVATQYDETGTELPKPVLHFVLPLDASGRAEARAFLRDHGPHVVCYRLDPRGEGVLMMAWIVTRSPSESPVKNWEEKCPKVCWGRLPNSGAADATERPKYI